MGSSGTVNGPAVVLQSSSFQSANACLNCIIVWPERSRQPTRRHVDLALLPGPYAYSYQRLNTESACLTFSAHVNGISHRPTERTCNIAGLAAGFWIKAQILQFRCFNNLKAHGFLTGRLLSVRVGIRTQGRISAWLLGQPCLPRQRHDPAARRVLAAHGARPQIGNGVSIPCRVPGGRGAAQSMPSWPAPSPAGAAAGSGIGGYRSPISALTCCNTHLPQCSTSAARPAHVPSAAQPWAAGSAAPYCCG